MLRSHVRWQECCKQRQCVANQCTSRHVVHDRDSPLGQVPRIRRASTSSSTFEQQPPKKTSRRDYSDFAFVTFFALGDQGDSGHKYARQPHSFQTPCSCWVMACRGIFGRSYSAMQMSVRAQPLLWHLVVHAKRRRLWLPPCDAGASSSRRWTPSTRGC